jgi:hypothetical protein
MTDRELMQRALDALEQMAKEGWLLHGPEGMDEAQTKCIQSLEALRARLAQPEQEPVAQVDYNERGNICWLFGKQVPDKTLLYTAPPQSEWQNAALRLGEELSTVGPDGYYNMSASEWLDWAMKHITPARIEQEPVAWFIEGTYADGTPSFAQVCETDPEFYVPLYAAPPQREWKGLTVDEFYDLDDVGRKMILEYGRLVEAKLKEKNAA